MSWSNIIPLYKTMTDKRFRIAWRMLLVVMVGCCLSEGWSEDTTLLSGAYALSLLSSWLCHRVRPRVAYGNLIVMVVYNTILAYNLVFNSRYGCELLSLSLSLTDQSQPKKGWLEIIQCCELLSLSLSLTDQSQRRTQKS